ncbi:MAG: imidazoleglycerol-phosphate dehydratase HisB [Clostridia bacterium]
MDRKASVERVTKETRVAVRMNVDGSGKYSVETGVGFFNHMLELFSKHSLMDLDIMVEGDIRIDCHHTVEDTGIVLGQAWKEALGDKQSIRRYASLTMPMDEALVTVSVDVSGRPFFVFTGGIERGSIGDMDTEAVEEFLNAFCVHAGITLHVNLLYGKNNHHIAEAVFKGLARALREAAAIDPREKGIPSTKGVI